MMQAFMDRSGEQTRSLPCVRRQEAFCKHHRGVTWVLLFIFIVVFEKTNVDDYKTSLGEIKVIFSPMANLSQRVIKVIYHSLANL